MNTRIFLVAFLGFIGTVNASEINRCSLVVAPYEVKGENEFVEGPKFLRSLNLASGLKSRLQDKKYDSVSMADYTPDFVHGIGTLKSNCAIYRSWPWGGGVKCHVEVGIFDWDGKKVGEIHWKETGYAKCPGVTGSYEYCEIKAMIDALEELETCTKLGD
jgi:hypothetical protein